MAFLCVVNSWGSALAPKLRYVSRSYATLRYRLSLALPMRAAPVGGGQCQLGESDALYD